MALFGISSIHAVTVDNACRRHHGNNIIITRFCLTKQNIHLQPFLISNVIDNMNTFKLFLGTASFCHAAFYDLSHENRNVLSFFMDPSRLQP